MSGEGTLPKHIVYTRHLNYDDYVNAKFPYSNEARIYEYHFTPSDLRSIADHMERQLPHPQGDAAARKNDRSDKHGRANTQ